MHDPRRFYDGLADLYHLIFEDWDRSIARQGEWLESVLRPLLPSNALVVDAAAGIGTQSLALAQHGFRVVGSDLSQRAVSRARHESRLRGLVIPVAVADFRALPFRSASADAIIACDNALPHLLSPADIAAAILELKRCTRPGGIVLISLRDYTVQPAGTREVRPYGERIWNGRRFFAEQEWLWEGETYRLTVRIRPVDAAEGDTLELETRYLAVPVGTVLDIMIEAGLDDVVRLDEPFYQPLLLGTVRGSSEHGAAA